MAGKALHPAGLDELAGHIDQLLHNRLLRERWPVLHIIVAPARD